MEDLPPFVSGIFIAVAAPVYGFLMYAMYRSMVVPKRNSVTLAASFFLLWLLVTGVLAFDGYFLNYDATPPRLIVFVAGMILLVMVVLIVFKNYIKRIPLATLTYIHIVRIPVELCLWWLFEAGMVAEEMTFEGMNYDILAGISAPFAAVFLVGRKTVNRVPVILWNVICLGLLLNIVIRAIWLTPYFYEGPGIANTGVFYFPFVWLPLFVVPAVFFSHLASLVKLFSKA